MTLTHTYIFQHTPIWAKEKKNGKKNKRYGNTVATNSNIHTTVCIKQRRRGRYELSMKWNTIQVLYTRTTLFQQRH